jgi:hypothetical protein
MINAGEMTLKFSFEADDFINCPSSYELADYFKKEKNQ